MTETGGARGQSERYHKNNNNYHNNSKLLLLLLPVETPGCPSSIGDPIGGQVQYPSGWSHLDNSLGHTGRYLLLLLLLLLL